MSIVQCARSQKSFDDRINELEQERAQILDEITAIFQRVEKDNPGQFKALEELARLRLETRPFFEINLRVKVGIEAYSEDQRKIAFEKFKSSGNEAYSQKDYKKAIDDYSQALRLNPQDLTIVYARTVAQLKLNESKQAWKNHVTYY